MLAWIAALYRPYVVRGVIVASPDGAEALERFARELPVPCDVRVQERPTGMLDAILIGIAALDPAPPDRVWITWADQVAVHPETVARLAAVEDDSLLAMPLVSRAHPYTHFDRDAEGRIRHVRLRREGHEMPPTGESDIGLFSLAREAACRHLPDFAREAVADAATRERNFLPFVPWIASRGAVTTFPATEEMEAVGINTPADLESVAAYLRRR